MTTSTVQTFIITSEMATLVREGAAKERSATGTKKKAAEAIAAARSGTSANATSPSAALGRFHQRRVPSAEAVTDEQAGPVASPRAHKNRTAPMAKRSLLLAHHCTRAAQRPLCLH